MRSQCRTCCPAGVETSYTRLDFLRDWASCPHELRACGPAMRRWSEAKSLITMMRYGNPDKTGGSRNNFQLLVRKGWCQRGHQQKLPASPWTNQLAGASPTRCNYRRLQTHQNDFTCLLHRTHFLPVLSPAFRTACSKPSFVSSTFLILVSRCSLDLIQLLSCSTDLLPSSLLRMR